MRNMPLIFRETKLAGVCTIMIERHTDQRGSFGRTFCREEFSGHGLAAEFVQASTSFNLRAGTLRGMHYQKEPHAEAKLVRCVRGKIHDVVADLRQSSSSFLQWERFDLHGGGNTMIYVPPGCAHGFQTLVDDTEVFYQMSVPYCATAADGFRFDDPAFGITWPLPVTVMSVRDLAWSPWTTVGGG
jgi:dTDP-4-dehydrorhamnose 3,5-epimerase